MPVDPILFATIAVALAASVLMGMFLRPSARRNRKWRSVSRREVCNVRGGTLAKIVGRVLPFGEGLTAPISARSCVYYRIEISRVQTGAEILRDESNAAFLVADHTGRAMVRPPGHFAILRDVNMKSGPVTQGGPLIDAFLAMHGLEKSDSLRYMEVAIPVDETIAVIGQVERAGAETTAIFITRPEFPLLITDETDILRG